MQGWGSAWSSEGPSSLLDEAPRVGDSVIVPATLWPNYVCQELGGAGWAARIRSVTKYTALVSFTYARTRDGRPYQDERVDWSKLGRIQ